MRMVDIIAKKRDGDELTREELHFAIGGLVDGSVPDYQVSAFLMAVYLQSMTPRETSWLTDCMAYSGDVLDLSAIKGVKVDKHSTGGVGDKTTLIVAPLAAACGVPVAKMSGRGLGHTGGTLDKMEAIPGMQVELTREAFFRQVQDIGIAVVGQSGNMAPADKKLYALRDVTATVSSIPLIASSVMSKKLAAGADAILLDVKAGSGAFMKTNRDAAALAESMVHIGESAGKRTIALISDMNVPLGQAIGNSLEVAEAADTLRGAGPSDLMGICLVLAATMLELAGMGDQRSCFLQVQNALLQGKGLEKLRQFVAAQGGDVSYIDDPARFPRAVVCREVRAPSAGYISFMDAERIGTASMVLGAGRERKEDSIDHTAGIRLLAKTGNRVAEGDVIAQLFTSSEERAHSAEEAYLEGLRISSERPLPSPLVWARVDSEGIHRMMP